MREALVSAVHTSSFEEEEAHLNGVVPQLVKKGGGRPLPFPSSDKQRRPSFSTVPLPSHLE